MKIDTGQFAELVVAAERTVQGVVAGATVESGAGLTAQGTVTGNITVRTDGVLVVQGVFAPDAVDNAGIIMASGVVQVPRARFSSMGNFCIAPGSIINGETILRTDGTEAPVETADGQSLTVSADSWCAWVPSEHRFITEAELKTHAEALRAED